jgi:CheY-like chemotaxis protein
MSANLNAIGAILWPVVVVTLFLFLLPTIRSLLKGSQSVNIEVAGTKISVQRAADETRKLIEDLQDRLNALESPYAPKIDHHEAEPPIPPLRPAKILWVDDRQNANVYERARVKEAGYALLQADSTASALETFEKDKPFQVIITDMGRVEAGGTYNPKAGLELIRKLRDQGGLTRVIVYSSNRSLAPVLDELRQIPNVGYTTSSSELMYLLGLSGRDVVP